MKYISRVNLIKLLDSLKKDYRVFVPVKKKDQRFYQKYTEFHNDIVIGEVRPFEPLKAFFARAREVVAEGFEEDLPDDGDGPFAIVGVKACDLKGFKVQDHVFLGNDYTDTVYAKMREENLIISSDCSMAIDTCFCLVSGDGPYPKENFDINLSLADEGYLIEIGSEKGEKIVEKNAQLFQEGNDNLIPKRDKRRADVTEDVQKNISRNGVPDKLNFEGMIEKNFDSPIWEEEAKACVECGACTIICPTCHCFLLYDQKSPERMARLRMWDSCMVKDYATVAGGDNPREKLWMRLRNRFEKKFDYFPKVAEMYACTGCGRCISACPAKIDIRKVLKRLVDDAGA